MAVRALLLTVGDELLSGKTVNRNAAFIGAVLTEEGFPVARQMSLPDDLDAIRRAVLGADEDIVILSGGLGPTSDDKTAEALSLAFGGEPRWDAAQDARIRAFFRARRRLPSESNLRQARVPAGFEALDNDHGTAPGLWRAGKPCVVALPGVPREMKPLLMKGALPKLRAAFRTARIVSAELGTCGIAESSLFDLVKGLPVPAGVRVAFLPDLGRVAVRFTGTDASAVAEAARSHGTALREWLYSTRGGEIEEALLGELRRRGKTLAVGESCTGGRVASKIASVPGASDVFLGGVVSYANRLKRDLLAVPADVLRRHGAVSEETALAMARGLRRATGADLAVAVTGVAGPGGGSAEKPVGTVWIAAAWEGRVTAHRQFFAGDRGQIQERAAVEALRRGWLRLAAEVPLRFDGPTDR